MIPTIDLIRAVNVTIIGHVLCYIALFLNYTHGQEYTHGGKAGIICAIIGLAAAYFHDGLYLHGTRFPKLAFVLNWLCILGVIASYLFWLTY